MRYRGLPLVIAGSRATNTPCQTSLRPKRRPIQPQPSLFDCFHPKGLHFGDRTASNRGRAATNRGELQHERRDTPATRRQPAPNAAKPPPPPVSSALQRPRARMGHRWVAEARQLHTRKVPRRNKSRPTRTTPRRFGTKLSQHTPRTACAGQNSPSTSRTAPLPVQNSPSTPLPTACAVQNSPSTSRTAPLPVQNSPSSPEMARFGAFSTCRESFVPFSPPRSRAGRILYRTRGRDGARQHNSTPGPTCVEGGGGLVWFCGPGVLRVVGCYWWCCAHWCAYWLGESQPSALWGCSSL